MIRLALFTIALILSSTFVFARTVQGKVVAADDSAAIVGASCRLLSGEEQLAVTTTDSKGIFSLTAGNKNKLTLENSLTGYSSTEIIIESGAVNLNVGNIYLDSATVLNEVTVKAQHIIHAKDRTIVYPSAGDEKSNSPDTHRADTPTVATKDTLTSRSKRARMADRFIYGAAPL